MKRIIILGDEGSGKKTLKGKISSQFSEFNFDIYTGKNLFSYNAAILVVNLADGVMLKTRECLLFAHKASIPNVFCFLNKSDPLQDKELIDLVIFECQELAGNYGYSGTNFFVATGSALSGSGIDSLVQQIQNNINKSYTQFNFRLPEYKCKNCKNVENIPFEICKVCNAKQKVSFWKKIFGNK